MSGIPEKIATLIGLIRDDVELETNLIELRLCLRPLNSSQLSVAASAIQFELIFDALNSSNQNQIMAAYEILKLALPHKHPSFVWTTHGPSLMRCLAHPTDEVREVALDQLIRCASEEQLIPQLVRDNSVLMAVLASLCDPELSVGQRAVTFLIKLASFKAGLNALCQPAVVKAANHKTDVNEVYKIRLFEVVVNIAATSEETLRHVEMHGLLSDLVKCLKSEDILANLATVEVMTPLVLCDHGYSYLHKLDILKYLAELLVTADTNPLASLFYPGLAKFFGYVGQKFPDRLLCELPDVLHSVLRMVDSDDMNMSITSLETIGFISYTTPGKTLLHGGGGNEMKNIMNKVSEAIIKLPTTWRVRAMGALTNLLQVEMDSSDGATQVSEFVGTWFDGMNPAAIDSLVDMARQPFLDLKLASLATMERLALHNWGQVRMASHPTLMEFLLDRTTETTQDGRCAKFNVLKVLAESPTSGDALGHYFFERVTEYVAQGPFDIGSNAGVLVDTMSQ